MFHLSCSLSRSVDKDDLFEVLIFTLGDLVVGIVASTLGGAVFAGVFSTLGTAFI